MAAKHVSYKGQSIDMELLKFKNQHQVALGNLHMNARGDIIGRGGSIIKTREELLRDEEREMQTPETNLNNISVSIKLDTDGTEQAFADKGNQFQPTDIAVQAGSSKSEEKVQEQEEVIVKPRTRKKKEEDTNESDSSM